MATQLKNKQATQEVLEERETPEENRPTVIGWQGMRCELPPDWNVTGFSLNRDNGYLRIDAPGNSALTAQIRWRDVSRPDQRTVYHLLAPKFRKWLRRPEPPVSKPDLKANLEKILKENAKQAKKAKNAFDSTIKAEKTEGENDERTAINFAWTGGGRGQGKIWYCSHCHRVVVAQVVGLAKDQNAIAAIASQLFATLHDHAEEGFDRWALYDLEMETPEDFRLESQKLMSGYLQLVFLRGAEKIVIDRWGLANITLKKFTPAEWFQNHALANLKRLTKTEVETEDGHELLSYRGGMSLFQRWRAIRDARLSFRRFPTKYAGGVWVCEETNKIYSLQVMHHRSSESLWTEVVKRCVCH